MVTIGQAYSIIPISTIGVIVNWSVLFAFVKLKSFKHAFGFLSANQAISDAFHSTFFLFYFCPMIFLESSIMRQYSPFPGFIILFSYEISVMTHLAISLNRLCAVWAPYKYSIIFSNNKTKILILAIWIIIGVIDITNYAILCNFYFGKNFWFWSFTDTEFCINMAWYGNGAKNATIVLIIIIFDILTVVKFRRVSMKVTSQISNNAQAKLSARETRFLMQTVIQGSAFFLEILLYFFIPLFYRDDEFYVFLSTSFSWVAVHAMDGVIVVVFNPEIRSFLFCKEKSQMAVSTRFSETRLFGPRTGAKP